MVNVPLKTPNEIHEAMANGTLRFVNYKTSNEYGYEEDQAFYPDFPRMIKLPAPTRSRWRWQGEIEVTRRQYSLWIGNIFLGEVVFNRNKQLWHAELSTQKYLQTVGMYKTEIEAHDALLDAAVDAFFGK